MCQREVGRAKGSLDWAGALAVRNRNRNPKARCANAHRGRVNRAPDRAELPGAEQDNL